MRFNYASLITRVLLLPQKVISKCHVQKTSTFATACLLNTAAPALFLVSLASMNQSLGSSLDWSWRLSKPDGNAAWHILGSSNTATNQSLLHHKHMPSSSMHRFSALAIHLHGAAEACAGANKPVLSNCFVTKTNYDKAQYGSFLARRL